jgi:hypothetical protein
MVHLPPSGEADLVRQRDLALFREDIRSGLGEIFDQHLRRMIIFLPLQFVVLLVVALIC